MHRKLSHIPCWWRLNLNCIWSVTIISVTLKTMDTCSLCLLLHVAPCNTTFRRESYFHIFLSPYSKPHVYHCTTVIPENTPIFKLRDFKGKIKLFLWMKTDSIIGMWQKCLLKMNSLLLRNNSKNYLNEVI